MNSGDPLIDTIAQSYIARPRYRFGKFTREIKVQIVRLLLQRYNGNRSAVAFRMGIHRNSVLRLLGEAGAPLNSRRHRGAA